ncbi:hypothetical protein PPYR_09412 [Photinus pyralis]|uniref:Tyrosine-protein phosphatase non-receptor type 23 n=2 Tax=Photinus pyralis TaxID=7054 RepID=A0A5N4AM58_PHOPY|nr:tyrosine-protein phosphatase non-receptor type 23 [Photinus pyralis]KAB0798419.1 hypothetical protein PPYR_09412 [Photinus pyralis]
MEAVPRLPMISFDLKTSTEAASFSSKLKQYISSFYHEDPEGYNTEIHNLETLRSAAVRPAIDVSGCQMLKKYYCQLHFLKSRFPMEDGQPCAVYFSWRDNYSNMVCSVADIDFELMNILFDIGAVHSKLGAEDSRVNPEGMKLACTHFQCAAWAFQTVRKEYPQMVSLVIAPEVIQFMQLICFAQAQECILEKSMMDNRKAAIIAKVVVQVVDYYKQALSTLQSTEDGSLSDLVGSRTYKDWLKYINFKIVYHKAIALLYQGEHAEEQQKMGERVAFYQAASDTLQEAYKKAKDLPNQPEISESLAFTTDVIEGKKKAAKNENEFIYHEEVPEMDALQEVRGASLVKGIAFSVNDTEVSGPDIFAKLIPMEAHEASSLYSEQKANLLRNLGEAVENKDKALAAFMSSLHLDGLSQMRQASGITQDVIDRAAAMSAKPTAIQDLVKSMSQLSNIYHDVESMLAEIETLIKEEEQKEKDYQSQLGSRPPSIIATDLTREYTKYHEAHSKACESNQNLHKAMTTHSANLKILSLPLAQINQQIPAIEFPNSNINEDHITEMEALLAKVDEMKKQRAMLWAQFHDAVKNDDITARLVTCTPQFTKEQLFEEEIGKHRNQAAVIEQNMAAQDNILKALVDAYARFTPTRRYIQDVLTRRAHMLNSLNVSFDTYDDLLAKANKGLEFYTKLETNVSKLLQRIKSTCKVQDEEREQILAKQNKPTVQSTGPKLKDYLEAKQLDNLDVRRVDNVSPVPVLDSSYSAVISGPLKNISDPKWPPAVRPAPLGSEMNTEAVPSFGNEQSFYPLYNQSANLNPYYNNSAYVTAATSLPQTTTTFTSNANYPYTSYDSKSMEQDLSAKMAGLMTYKQPQSTDYSAQSFNQPQPEEISSSTRKSSADTSYGAMYAGNYPYQTPAYTYGTTQPQNYPVVSTPNTSALPHYQPADSYSQSNAYMQRADTYSQGQNHVYDQTISSQGQAVQPSIPSSYPQTCYMQTQFQTVPTYSQSDSYVQPVPPTSNYAPGTYESYASVGTLHNASYTQTSMGTYNYTPSVNPTASTYSDASAAYAPENTYAAPNSTYQNYSVTSTDVYPAYSGGVYQQYGSQFGGNYDAHNNYYVANGVASQPHLQYTGVTPITAAETTSNYQLPPTTAQSLPSIQPQQVAQAKKVASNIDLLSGLDFTINQAPLVPQPNKIENTTKDVPSTKPPEQIPVRPAVKLDERESKPVLKPVMQKKPIERNSFQDPDLIKQFTQEVEKLEKFVDILSTKTLSGPTSLELKWKEIQDRQDAEQHRKSISVARCYPMKNRFPDILPYDQTRVVLIGRKDDYINASYIKDISPNSPEFIVTQCPLSSTFHDFWVMVCNENAELILCLLNDNEIGNDKYWPVSKPLTVGNYLISMTNQIVKPYWTDTEILINEPDERILRKIRLIQFTAWPSSLFPLTSSVSSFLTEILNDPTVHTKPIVLHCFAGIGRSGLLCLLLSAITEILVNPSSIPDLPLLATKLSSARKNIVRDREHFKFAYQVLLHFLKDFIAKHVLKKVVLDDSFTKIDVQAAPEQPSDDPLSLLDPLWATKKGA